MAPRYLFTILCFVHYFHGRSMPGLEPCLEHRATLYKFNHSEYIFSLNPKKQYLQVCMIFSDGCQNGCRQKMMCTYLGLWRISMCNTCFKWLSRSMNFFYIFKLKIMLIFKMVANITDKY